MLTIVLVIIYIAFISLGLPDSILGSAWPVIHQELGVPVSFAGIETMIISGGTIISSFFSEKLIRRFGTGKVTAVSVALTAGGLLGVYLSPGFFWICLLGVPLGIGAGAVDSALNNFVALHYKAKHMNWLHCFWGIGATTGPIIMSAYLMRKHGWRLGYLTIGILQAVLVIFLVISLPLWKKFEQTSSVEYTGKSENKVAVLLKMPGAKPALIGFFCYCAAELTVGLWGSSYLVIVHGISAQRAATWVSLYYLGITVGRFIAGFIAIKLENIKMIRIGQSICILGAVILLLPISNYIQLAGFILIGLGCAPIYPAMLHETPNRFGKEKSQGIMGIQMAVAYIGSTFMPPLFGVIANTVGFHVLPLFLLIAMAGMLAATEVVNKMITQQNILQCNNSVSETNKVE